MKILGKKPHPFIKGEEVDDIQIEEIDFKGFETNWDDLDIDTKAMFCSFLHVGYLSRKGQGNEPEMRGMWEYYQLKHNGADY